MECLHNGTFTGLDFISKQLFYKGSNHNRNIKTVLSIQVLQNVEPGEDLAVAHFNYGKYFMKILEMTHNVNTKELRNCALEQFELVT